MNGDANIASMPPASGLVRRAYRIFAAFPRSLRLALFGGVLVCLSFCCAVFLYAFLGWIAYPSDDRNLLITFPPWPTDKFWYTTFSGRNHEVTDVQAIDTLLRQRIRVNNARYGDAWQFGRITLVGHGGPGYLIFELGGANFTVQDIPVFALVRDHAGAGTEIVIRSCSMLEEEKGREFISALAAAANCPVSAWSDVGMYNGLIQLGRRYTAMPDGSIRTMDG